MTVRRYINSLSRRVELRDEFQELADYTGAANLANALLIEAVESALAQNSPMVTARTAFQDLLNLPDNMPSLSEETPSGYQSMIESWMLDDLGNHSTLTGFSDLYDALVGGNTAGSFSDFQGQTGKDPANASLWEVAAWNADNKK